MFTINYKGVFIHGYCDKPEVRVGHPDNIIRSMYPTLFKTYKSLRSAKIAITKACKEPHALNDQKNRISRRGFQHVK